MKRIGYFFVVMLILQHSCKKESLQEDSFYRYDNYSQLTVDSVDYILDERDGGVFSSIFITDTISNNDSIWLCIGSRLSDRNGYTYSGLLGFYFMTKLAVKDLEIEIDSAADIYYLSIHDLLKLFSPNQELNLSQADLLWMKHPNSLGTGVVFTWGFSEQFRSTSCDSFSNQNKSSCIVVRSEIHDSESIKVELDFDVYLKHHEIDTTIHIESSKMIVLIYRQ